MLVHYVLDSGFSALITLAAPTTFTEYHKYVLISARGTGEPQCPSIGFKGMINQILTTIPGGIEYDVCHVLVFQPTFNLIETHTVYPAQADKKEYVGAADITHGLVGYSQGATVVSYTLKNLTDTISTAYSPTAITAIKSTIVIENPVHEPFQASNVDENVGKSTDEYTGSLVWYMGRMEIPSSMDASA